MNRIVKIIFIISYLFGSFFTPQDVQAKSDTLSRIEENNPVTLHTGGDQSTQRESVLKTGNFIPLPVVKADVQQQSSYTTSIAMEFIPENIALKSVSRLTITVTNPNSYAMTGVAWTDNFPTYLAISDPSNLSNTCSGTVAAVTGTSTLSLSGGSIAANGTCTVSVDVKANQSGNYDNSIAIGGLTTTVNGETVSNTTAASDTLNVATFDYPAEINKSFSPISIAPGETSVLTVMVYNANAFALTDVAWSDTFPDGLKVASPSGLNNKDCGGTVTAASGATTISLSGGSVPAQVASVPGSCTITMNVTTTKAGNSINTINTGALSAKDESKAITIGNTTPASATLQVDEVVAPSVSKNFSPNTVWINSAGTMTVRIRNNDTTHTLSEAALTDTLPTGLVLANPVNSSTSGCGSPAITGTSGSDTIAISGATISPSSYCTINASVTSSTPGVYINSIPVGAVTDKQGVTNAAKGDGQLNVQAVGITKAFINPTTHAVDSSIQAGDTTTLTITLENRDTTKPYTSAYLVDNLPNPLQAVDAGSGSTTCGSGTVTLSGSPLRKIELSGGTVPQATDASHPGTCTVTVDVTTPSGATGSTPFNTIGANVLTTAEGVTNYTSTSASITITPITIAVGKFFSPSRFQAGGTTTLTVTLSNSTKKDFTNVGLVDTLPAGLTLKGTATKTCTDGSVSYSNDSPSKLTLSGVTMPHGYSCSMSVQATTSSSATTQSFTNSIAANTVTSTEGVTNQLGTSAGVSIYTTGTGVTGSKSFSPTVILAGGSSRLTIDLYAPEDQGLSNFAVTDTLPSGIVVSSTPSASASGCGSPTFSPGEGATSISLTGGTVSAGALCRIQVNVTGDTSGSYTNTLSPGNITNTENQTLASAKTAPLRITNLSIGKAFYPTKVSQNGLSTLTITLQNTNTSALSSTSLTDYLPSGVVVATPPNSSTTCGGTPGIAAGSGTITLTNGTVPAQVGAVPGICTITLDVKGTGTAGTYTNTIQVDNVSATISGSEIVIKPIADASAQLIIAPLSLGVVKGFDPLTVFGGSSSTISIQLINPNDVVLTGIKLTDAMPTGMYIADPVNASTGTCGGTITAAPGSSTFSFSGGVIAASKRCTLTLSITMNVNGNRTNTIAANAVTSFNGAKNPQPASASLTNLPGASISKFFTPNSLVAGDTTTLTIRIKNTGNIALSGIGLTDTLPSGLIILSSPSPTNACNGSLTTDIPNRKITLTGGSLMAGPNTTCDLTVAITAPTKGTYVNTIAKSSLTTSEGATNTEEATDTLTVSSAPDLQITKNIDMTNSSPAPFEKDDIIAYTIIATNAGDVPLTNVTIADSDLGVIMGTCTPAQGSALNKGETMSCSATHVVTDADVTATTYTNTASADSDQTEPVSDSTSVPINTTNAMSIKKTLTTTGAHNLGDTLNYSITVTNIGSATLTNVALADPNATLGTCTPAQPVASFAPGAILSCPASHVVTLTDVNAGTFTNTATADSNETEPVSDSVSTPVQANAKLTIDKQVTSSISTYTVGSIITYDISAMNTGDITLHNVTVVDNDAGVTLGTCSPAQPATLAKGEIISCSASHTVTADDMTNGGYTNTATADSDETNPVSDKVTVITKTPDITLTKNGALDKGDGKTNAGDIIHYTFTIKNSGEVTLTNVTLTDIAGGITLSGGPIGSLAAGATDSTTFTGTYTLTQADIDAGSFTNTATATGIPPIGSPVSSTSSKTISSLQEAAIDLVKTESHTFDSPVKVGNPVQYTFTVENTGNTTLNSIVLNDAKCDSSPAYQSGDTVNTGKLDVGEKWTYTCSHALTQGDLDAGSLVNTATVTSKLPAGGTGPTDTDTKTVTIVTNPGIDLVKSENHTFSTPVVAGNTVNYSFTVQNTGNVTLNTITLTDAKCKNPPIIQSGDLDSDGKLDVGETWTYTCAHTLTQADVDAGTLVNTATVTSKLPAGGTGPTDTDTKTVTLEAAPGIDLVKSENHSAFSTPVMTGNSVTYTFTVKNTGNVTLNTIVLSDLKCNSGPTYQSGDSTNSGKLDVNETWTYICTHTLTQDDVDAGSLVNTAAVTSKLPAGGDGPTDTDTKTVTLTPAPAIDLVKSENHSAFGDPAVAGNTVAYTFTVHNTGNVTLNTITLTDEKCDTAPAYQSGDTTNTGILDLGETWTYTCPHALTQGDVDAGNLVNTATVTSKLPAGGDGPTDTDSKTITIPSAPSIQLTKNGTFKMDIVKPDDRVDAGDKILYTFTIKNIGNVTLTNITVTDSVTGVTLTGSTIGSLAPDASDTTTYTAEHVITQADIDAGTFSNTDSVSGSSPTSVEVTDGDTKDLTITPASSLGVAKRVVSSVKLSPGTYDVTYEVKVQNYGNVTLNQIQLPDDLKVAYPTPTTFTVQSITGTSLIVNTAYNGNTEMNLLGTGNQLAPGASGTLTFVVRVIPASHGSFNNSITGTSTNPKNGSVDDVSQDGSNPDSDNDGNPGNNSEPTPVDFGANLFDPPIGVKSLDANGEPVLKWTMVWINNSNIVGVTNVVHDPIPENTVFVPNLTDSGYAIPSGAPKGSSSLGVSCTSSSATVTSLCYYEGPSATYPRGQIIWAGTMGADFGAKDAASAQNEIVITYSIKANDGIKVVNNVATIDTDRNGDGSIDDAGERQVASASAKWDITKKLPKTGFAQGQSTIIPEQPKELLYTDMGSLWIEIPSIGVKSNVVGVPHTSDGWDVTWLGNDAGYLDGTAYPTTSGNSVITGHVWDALNNPGLFAGLKSLKYGDPILIHAWGQTYQYEVRENSLVSPDQTNTVLKHEEQSWITLLTCENYDQKLNNYANRRMVRAVLINVQP